MKKAIIGLIILASIVLAMTATVFGGEETPLTADLLSNKHNHESGYSVLESGQYYLNSDLYINNAISIEQGADVTIDLRGHMITWGEGEKTPNVFYAISELINNNGNLTITDSVNKSSTEKHYFSVTEDSWELCTSALNSKNIDDLTTKPGNGQVIAVTGGCLVGNDEYNGHPLIENSEGVLTISNVYFIGNTSSAIKNNNSQFDISNCGFYGNCIDGDGGAVYCKESKGIIKNCTIKFNRAKNGGGLSVVGTFDDEVYKKSEVLIEDCSISNNSADSGGGIYSLNSVVALCSTSISDNTATSNGGGVLVSKDEESCLIAGTKVTMADGSVKNIEEIRDGDMVRIFDHEAGQVSSEKVCYVYESKGEHESFTLRFSNGIELGVVGKHGLFEKESNRYVNISEANADSFIGKHFYNGDTGNWEELLSVSHNDSKVKYYSIYSAKHMNCVTNGLISVVDDVVYAMNAFALDENLKIDPVKKQADIDKYGLFRYEECQFSSREDYENWNYQYIKIFVGKGLISWDEIISRGLTIKEYDNNRAESASPEFAKVNGNVLSLLGGNQKQDISIDDLSEIDAGTLVIGSGTKIKDNKAGEEGNYSDNNVYLDLEYSTIIKILDGANNMEVGVSASKTPSEEVSVAITNGDSKDYSKYFNSDDKDFTVKYVADEENGHLVLTTADHSCLKAAFKIISGLVVTKGIIVTAFYHKWLRWMRSMYWPL